MRTYTVVLYAEDVPHYGTREFKVADDTLAIERAKGITPEALSTYTTDAEYSNSRCRRIVHIEGPDGIIAEGIYLEPGEPRLLTALEEAFALLNRIRDTLHYEDGLPVTFLEGRNIEIIHGDTVTVLERFQPLIQGETTTCGEIRSHK